MTNVIEVGQSSTAAFLAFGDDSVYKEIASFSYILIARNKIQNVVRQIRDLKIYFNIPNEIPLHCRILNNRHQLRKLKLNHLDNGQFFRILRRCVKIINSNKIVVRSSYCDLTKMPAGSEELILTDDDGNELRLTAVKEPKGLVGNMALLCWAVAPHRSQGPLAQDCQIFASPDQTKIKFIGQNKQQAHNLLSGFVDIGAPAGKVFKVSPIIGDGGFPDLMQIADVCAYLNAHRFSSVNEKLEISNIAHQIRYFQGSEANLNLFQTTD